LGYNTCIHGNATKKPCVVILKAKISFFFFFVLYKIREKEGRTDPAWGDWYQWEEERGGRV
jgi:hypothetical protein